MAEGWVRRESNVVAHPGVKKEVPDLDDSKEVIRPPAAWAQTMIESRTLPLHPATVAALREWLQTGWIALVGRAPGPDDFLFPGLNGRGARPRSAELIRYDLAAVGLPIEFEGQPIEFKATRSSFSSWLDGADAPRERIKRLLGH